MPHAPMMSHPVLFAELSETAVHGEPALYGQSNPNSGGGSGSSREPPVPWILLCDFRDGDAGICVHALRQPPPPTPTDGSTGSGDSGCGISGGDAGKATAPTAPLLFGFCGGSANVKRSPGLICNISTGVLDGGSMCIADAQRSAGSND